MAMGVCVHFLCNEVYVWVHQERAWEPARGLGRTFAQFMEIIGACKRRARMATRAHLLHSERQAWGAPHE